MVLAEKNLVWHIFKSVCFELKHVGFVSACLAFIEVVWHIFTNDLAYVVNLNVDSLTEFCGFSATEFCIRYFVKLRHISHIRRLRSKFKAIRH